MEHRSEHDHGGCIASAAVQWQRVVVPADRSGEHNGQYRHNVRHERLLPGLALVQSSTPLPVELLYFDALPDGREVRCSWATATEQDNDFFTVERSADGTLFEDIGEVEGAGSSHATLHYAFMDPSPLPGLSYYRLQQTDFDGSAVLSNIVPVWMQAGAVDVPLVLWPNPAHEVLNIVGTAAGERLSVWDGSGRLTLEVGAAQEGLTVVDVSHLPEGVYMLRIGGAGKERVSRFVRADR